MINFRFRPTMTMTVTPRDGDPIEVPATLQSARLEAEDGTTLEAVSPGDVGDFAIRGGDDPSSTLIPTRVRDEG